MSNRKSAFLTPQSNPSKKTIKWKSTDKCFSYYDTEQKTQVQVLLPFKFLVLDELHAVSGWNDSSSSAIYSNEVKFISKENVIVKSFKGGEIARGIYKEIKDKIVMNGGHYVKSIYVMLEDGTLANLQLKGSAVSKWSDFTQKTRSRLADEWVEVKTVKEDKKGGVKFNVPEFTFSSSLNDSDAENADKCFDELEAYLKTYLSKAEIAEIDQDININDQDLFDLDI